MQKTNKPERDFFLFKKAPYSEISSIRRFSLIFHIHVCTLNIEILYDGIMHKNIV